MSLLSVLLPVRDAESTVARALQSVQEQQGVDFECVVVDDGSIDATVSVVQRTVRGDDRFQLIRQGRDGLVPALLRAVDASGGQFLGRQDADDESLPGRFKREVDYLTRNPRLGLVATGVEIRSRTGMTAGAQRYLRWLEESCTPSQIANALWIESPLPHPTVVFSREVYDRVGGYRDRGWPEDYDLWLRMRRQGVLMEKIPEPLYRWTDHPDRASRTLETYSRENFLLCRAHHLARFLGSRSVWVWGAGREGKRFGRALLAEGVSIEGFIDIDPRKVGGTARGRPVVGAEWWLAQATDPTRRGDPLSTGGHSPPSPLQLPVLSRGPIVLVAVGTSGARKQIQGRLRGIGLREGVDFLPVA